MEHRPSSAANSSSPSQEIPRILWNPMVHYCVHNRPLLVPIQNQIKPVRARPTHFKDQFNIIPSPTPRFRIGHFSSGYLPNPCMNVSFASYVPHAPPPSYALISTPQFHWVRGTNHADLQLAMLSSLLLLLLPLRPSIILSTPFSNTP